MTMVTRRGLLRGLGGGAVVIAASPALAEGTRSTSAIGTPVASPLRRYDNENVYGPSPRAMEALRQAAGGINEYPDTQVANLRAKIADLHRVTPERVVLGAGSTDVLRMAAAAFLGGGKTLIAARPTCDLMPALAAAIGANAVSVRLSDQHTHDLAAMQAACNARTGLVYICNPHNPTGTVTRRGDLDLFINNLRSGPVILIDEAYHHYVASSPDATSFLEVPASREAVVVVRSLSKIYGLAGLRVGYAVTSARLAKLMTQHALPMSVSGVAAIAASAALDDHEYVQISLRRNTDDRQEFFNNANARMVRVIDSQTNFAMVNTAPQPATQVIDHFAKHGMSLPAPSAGYGSYVRVSIDTADRMAEFWRIWDLMPSAHSHG